MYDTPAQRATARLLVKPMISAPSVTSAALLLAFSLFLGLAFEDFFARTNSSRPGGIRTFPMLAVAGGVLYLFDPAISSPSRAAFWCSAAGS